jgi:SpoVK/Ycf46/Vps4 family AAA+-type ATPase
MKTIFSELKAGNPDTKHKVDYTEDEYSELARACQGLTDEEIENNIALCLTARKELVPEVLFQEKKQVVKKNGILEFIDTDVIGGDVGGLDLVKSYLTKYSKAFTPEAQKFGVEPLKGVILLGIPGGGKSLLAKSLSHMWKLPLLRLDVGKVMGRLVGDSENNMRNALATAEAVSPCILFLDEIEKGLSGTQSSGQTDGGTTARVFGTLLTAMQEGLKDVIVIGTANSISALPPELIRRFNEVFFVDLPFEEERKEIFDIHLRKRGRKIKKFDIDSLVSASEGFTGAEIEKAIKDGIAAAFYDNAEDVTDKYLLDALNDTKPISKVQGEKIKELQKWAENHARYASSYSVKKLSSTKAAVKIDNINLDSLDGDLEKIKTPSEKKEEAVENQEKTKSRFNNIEDKN